MTKATTDAPGTELVLTDDPEEMIAVLTGTAEVAEHDPAETQAAIIRAILLAPDLDAAFADTPVFGTPDLVGVPLEINSVKVAKSKYGKDGKGGYLIAFATNLEDGSNIIFTTSAAKVAARILWLQMHDMLPFKIKVREPVESGQGFKVYDVESA